MKIIKLLFMIMLSGMAYGVDKSSGALISFANFGLDLDAELKQCKRDIATEEAVQAGQVADKEIIYPQKNLSFKCIHDKTAKTVYDPVTTITLTYTGTLDEEQLIQFSSIINRWSHLQARKYKTLLYEERKQRKFAESVRMGGWYTGIVGTTSFFLLSAAAYKLFKWIRS